jgi:hypothetical protein
LRGTGTQDRVAVEVDEPFRRGRTVLHGVSSRARRYMRPTVGT